MKRHIRLLAVLSIAAVALVGCGSDDGTDSPDAGGIQPSGDATEEGPAGGVAGGSQLALTSLMLDGQAVPMMGSCAGVDGAVRVTTEGGVIVTLVQEDGTALRYDGEGAVAETSEVTAEEIGEVTIYRGTVSSDQVDPAVEIQLEVADTAYDELPAC